MGTTLVALLVDGEQAALAHVGDSRAYRVSRGRLDLLTSDHTWVAEQVHAGNLSEEQARTHPFKSVVTRALGGDREVSVEVAELDLEPGDVYLLCSDGLTGMVDDDAIRRHLTGASSLEEACRSLVFEANRSGGKDNITALLLAVEEA
jgi:protein phosphatase